MPARKKEILDTLALKGKKLTPREKMMPIFVLVIIALTLVLFFRPALISIIETRKQIEEKKVLLESLSRQRSVLNSLQSGPNAEITETQFKNVERYLPSTKPSLQTLTNLSQLARMEGVQFSGLSLKPGKVNDYTELPADTTTIEPRANQSRLENFEISFSLTGSRDKLLSFIAKMKEISPIMKLEYLSFSVNPSASGDISIMNASLKIVVYYQTMPKYLPSPDAPFQSLSGEEVDFLNELNTYLLAERPFNNEGFFNDEGVYGVVFGVSNPFVSLAELADQQVQD
ncbi:MAG: hypothetical protein ACOX6V_00385 [Patescibacteria group bacterium]|jgi:Tfp pilus assembly protein PilO